MRFVILRIGPWSGPRARFLAVVAGLGLLLGGCPEPQDRPPRDEDADGRSDAVDAVDDGADEADALADPSAAPAGATVLAEVSGQLSATDPLVLELPGVRLIIPPQPEPLAGTTVTARLMTGVAKTGRATYRGRVVQIVPSGLVLVNPAALRFAPGPVPATTSWLGLTASEGDAAWSEIAAAPLPTGEAELAVPHFSLWSVSPVGTAAGLAHGASTPLVSGAGVAESAHYRMVFTLGDPSPAQGTSSSTSYRMQGGTLSVIAHDPP